MIDEASHGVMEMAIEARVARLEGITEQVNDRLAGVESTMSSRFSSIDDQFSSIENRLNVRIQLTVAMWVTTMIGVIATLATVILRTQA